MTLALAPSTVVGGYRLVSALGSGGMGEVWLAEHAVLGRSVAIKFLRPNVSSQPEMVERFFDEAVAATKIVDPGIVHVHDFGWHEGAAYIVMEKLVGESLAHRLAQRHVLKLEVALRLATQVALTMAVAHGRGIVHRDLKPDNLFVISDSAIPGGERIKILDFGIAKLLAEDVSTSRTQSGAILGTPMYMSPEQCRGRHVDHRTDVYALGGVLFHMICGRPPFIGETSGDMIASHLLEDPPLPSSVVQTIPPGVDAIVMRCLAKAAEDRYASMSDLARALSEAAGMALDIETIVPAASARIEASVLTPPPGPSGIKPANIGLLPTLATGESLAPVRIRRRWWLAAFAVLGIAIVGIMLMAWLPTASGSRDREAGTSDAAVAVPTDAAVVVEIDAAIITPSDAGIRPALLDAGIRRVPDANIRRVSVDAHTATVDAFDMDNREPTKKP